MIVMHSLFEEQITSEQLAMTRSMEAGVDSFAEALTYLPELDDYALGTHEYLEHVRRIKAAVSVPVIGSLNGTTPGGWLEYSRLIEEAGADGLELNLYELATDLDETGGQVEERSIEVVRSVREAVRIPLAVKLSPFYSSIANFAAQLDRLGVDAILLFNRFYQPDIDVDQLEVLRVNLSSPSELLLRLRWLAVLSGACVLRWERPAASTPPSTRSRPSWPVHTAYRWSPLSFSAGPIICGRFATTWPTGSRYHEYESLAQMQGSMSLLRCDNPKMYERANYMKILQSWEF